MKIPKICELPPATKKHNWIQAYPLSVRSGPFLAHAVPACWRMGSAKKGAPGPGGLDSDWMPVWKGIWYLGVPLESRTTGPQTTNLPVLESKRWKKNIPKITTSSTAIGSSRPIFSCVPQKLWTVRTNPEQTLPMDAGCWSFTMGKMVSSQLLMTAHQDQHSQVKVWCWLPGDSSRDL